ncbi:MAG: T9SS type A sorting domain-containing protein [Candidatus Symbiothrix sp.]|jgi:hypothetical protein|nr:T9SS type A sorting domain-containing protein [Candidatus Symbiothrix sp.]
MKKFYFLLVAFLMVAAMPYAQDVTVFDFESGSMDVWTIGMDEMAKVDNPHKDAVNPSENVGKYTHREIWQQCGLWLSNPVTSRVYNSVQFKYLIPSGEKGKITVELMTTVNGWWSVMYTYDSGFLVGDGAWHLVNFTLPISREISAVAVGFNQRYNPGGLSPDEGQQNGASGLNCYFDDLILKKTTDVEHVLYFEPFTKTDRNWESYDGPANECPPLIGGLPLVSESNIELARFWGDTHDYALRLHHDRKPIYIYGIDANGYEDYSIKFEQRWVWDPSEIYWHVTDEEKLFNVAYQYNGPNGLSSWIELTDDYLTGIFLTEQWTTFYKSFLPEGVSSINLRISAQNCTPAPNITNLSVSGVYTGETVNGLKKTDTVAKAFYQAATQTVNAGKDAQITIFNAGGSFLQSTSHASFVNVSHLQTGVYIAKITTLEGTSVLKFVK